MKQQTYKPLEKKDFKLLYGMVIGANIIAGLIFNLEFPVIIIACCSVFISLVIAFLKLFRKPESKKALYWIWGVVGIFNAIVMSLYFSLIFNTELKNKALIFSFCIIVVAIICALMKLLIAYSTKKSQSGNTKTSPTRFSKLPKIGATFGAVLGIYLSRSGIITKTIPQLTKEHLALAGGILLFSVLSTFLFVANIVGDYDEKNKLY